MKPLELLCREGVSSEFDLEMLCRALMVDWTKRRGDRRDHLDSWINGLLHILSDDAFANMPPQALRVPGAGPNGTDLVVVSFEVENLRLMSQRYNISSTPGVSHVLVPLTPELATAGCVTYGITLTADIRVTSYVPEVQSILVKGIHLTDLPSLIDICVRDDPGMETGASSISGASTVDVSMSSSTSASRMRDRETRIQRMQQKQTLEYPFLLTKAPPPLPFATGNTQGLLVVHGRPSYLKPNEDSLSSMVRISRDPASNHTKDPTLDIAACANTIPRGRLTAFVNGHAIDGVRIMGCPIFIEADETANGTSLGPITVRLSRDTVTKCRFPLPLLFNAYGVASDDEIRKYIFGNWDMVLPTAMSVLQTTLDWKHVTRIEAQSLIKECLTTNLEVDRILHSALLPHLGTDATADQARLETIGNIVYMLICEHLSPGSFLNDINNQRNRRTVMYGDLMVNEYAANRENSEYSMATTLMNDVLKKNPGLRDIKTVATMATREKAIRDAFPSVTSCDFMEEAVNTGVFAAGTRMTPHPSGYLESAYVRLVRASKGTIYSVRPNSTREAMQIRISQVPVSLDNPLVVSGTQSNVRRPFPTSMNTTGQGRGRYMKSTGSVGQGSSMMGRGKVNPTATIKKSGSERNHVARGLRLVQSMDDATFDPISTAQNDEMGITVPLAQMNRLSLRIFEPDAFRRHLTRLLDIKATALELCEHECHAMVKIDHVLFGYVTLSCFRALHTAACELLKTLEQQPLACVLSRQYEQMQRRCQTHWLTVLCTHTMDYAGRLTMSENPFLLTDAIVDLMCLARRAGLLRYPGDLFKHPQVYMDPLEWIPGKDISFSTWFGSYKKPCDVVVAALPIVDVFTSAGRTLEPLFVVNSESGVLAMLDASTGFDLACLPFGDMHTPAVMCMVDCGVVDLAERSLRNVPKHALHAQVGDHYAAIHPLGYFGNMLSTIQFSTHMPINRASVNKSQMGHWSSSANILRDSFFLSGHGRNFIRNLFVQRPFTATFMGESLGTLHAPMTNNMLVAFTTVGCRNEEDGLGLSAIASQTLMGARLYEHRVACKWKDETLPKGVPVRSFRMLAFCNRLAGPTRVLAVGDRIKLTDENAHLFVSLDIPGSMPEVYKQHEEKMLELSKQFATAESDARKEDITKRIQQNELHNWSGVCVDVSEHGEWARVKFEDMPTVFERNRDNCEHIHPWSGFPYLNSRVAPSDYLVMGHSRDGARIVDCSEYARSKYTGRTSAIVTDVSIMFCMPLQVIVSLTQDVDRLTEASKNSPVTAGKGCPSNMIAPQDMMQLLMPSGDMIMPSMIIDPHSVAGRTVFSVLIDASISTVAARKGKTADATPLTPVLDDYGDASLNYHRFLNPTDEDVATMLTKAGELYERAPAIDGVSGRLFGNVFYGYVPVATLRNLCRVRGSGRVTTRDNRTRSRTSANCQQMSHMEHQCLHGSGAEQFASSKFSVSADGDEIMICKNCKISVVEGFDRPVCTMCQRTTPLRTVLVQGSKPVADAATMANGVMMCNHLRDESTAETS